MSIIGLGLKKIGNSAYRDVDAVYSHILDPNERRRMVLADIDKAPLSWYHLCKAYPECVSTHTDVSVTEPASKMGKCMEARSITAML